MLSVPGLPTCARTGTRPAAAVIVASTTATPGPVAIAAAQQFKRDVNELNASLTYAMDMGLELSVWGRNITNDRYIIQIFDSPAQNGSVSAYTNQPRTWGGSIRYRW